MEKSLEFAVGIRSDRDTDRQNEARETWTKERAEETVRVDRARHRSVPVAEYEEWSASYLAVHRSAITLVRVSSL